jgi:hypothetical protein
MPSAIVRMQRISGEYLVCSWQDTEIVRVRVVEGTPLPAPGSIIRIWYPRLGAHRRPVYATYRGDNIADAVQTILEHLLGMT